MATSTLGPTLTVRFYAAAGAATGVPEAELPRPTTLGELTDVLLQRYPALGSVLAVSSVLVDGVVATTRQTPLAGVHDVDVLPPFAGG